jgi:hypothetical protein
MNKTYEIEYHIEGYVPIQREVVTVDGRSMRQNRLPVCLIEYAQRISKGYGAYRFRIHDYLPPHISGAGVTLGVARLAYEEELSDVQE